jgi:hypothetical protein
MVVKLPEYVCLCRYFLTRKKIKTAMRKIWALGLGLACLTTACEKEDEIKIDKAALVGIWELTHTAHAGKDGFTSFEAANKWLAAFDWESVKEAIDVDDYSGSVFTEFDTDGNVLFYYPNLYYPIAEKSPYKMNGADILLEGRNEGEYEVYYRITTLSATSLVLEEVDEYMVHEDPEEEGTVRVSINREFYQKRTAVPDKDDYEVYE